MFDLYDDGKKDSTHSFAGIQISAWRNNAMQKYGPNYIDQAPMNGDIIRWDPKTFPLSVYVSAQDNSTYPEYYNAQVMKAFSQWVSSSGFLAFKFTNNSTAADIVVTFKPTPTTDCNAQGCTYVSAYTEPIIRNRMLKQMIITIYDKDATGAFFSDKELYNTILHEVGHSLGIMGHSYSTDDLMYMANEATKGRNTLYSKHRSDFQYIGHKDISTLRLLYNIVPTISNTDIHKMNTANLLYAPVILGTSKMRGSQKLKEAKNYIAQAPSLPNGYIDLGIAYDELNELDKALEAFKQAYNVSQRDEDRFIVLYNISAMYLNHGNPELAMQYAKQAQDINPSEDIVELISNIEHSMNTKSKPFWTGRKK